MQLQDKLWRYISGSKKEQIQSIGQILVKYVILNLYALVFYIKIDINNSLQFV